MITHKQLAKLGFEKAGRKARVFRLFFEFPHQKDVLIRMAMRVRTIPEYSFLWRNGTVYVFEGMPADIGKYNVEGKRPFDYYTSLPNFHDAYAQPNNFKAFQFYFKNLLNLFNQKV